MDWLYRLLSLVALVIKLLDETIKLTRLEATYVRGGIRAATAKR